MARKTKQTSAIQRAAELRAELEMIQLRQAIKVQRSLSIYQGADKGRRNKDWKASNASADLAIMSDSATLIARARQLSRDSWIARSIVGAFARNVVGTGIIPKPQCRAADGTPDVETSRELARLFMAWANDRNAVDPAGRQTFWAMQTTAENERVTAGGVLWVWSYGPPLQLRAIEYEQLDTTIQSSGQNEVRGGVELDQTGKPVAYHVYSRNPNDYQWRQGYQSVRIPADRVFHYYASDRVAQTRGVTTFAPVMQEIRDIDRYKHATLWRSIMESCIGVLVKQNSPTSTNPFTSMTRASGDDGTTASGLRTVDFIPGMVGVLNPGEDVQPFTPSSPGNQFEPYMRTMIRAVGAGVGLSYSQIARQSESNYSAARQDMLEDRKAFEPLQELMAHSLVLPVYRLFAMFAAAEGLIDSSLLQSPYLGDAEYVAPPQTWIDPEKELNAIEKGLALKVLDRSEVASMKGQRLEDIFASIKAEQELARIMGIDLGTSTTPAAAPAPEAEDDGEEKETKELPDDAELAAMPAPNYRPATGDDRCANCAAASGMRCTRYGMMQSGVYVCDSYAKADAKVPTPPGVPDGDPPLDHQDNEMNSRAARGVEGD
jgi:lambda family phage portal protein